LSHSFWESRFRLSRVHAVAGQAKPSREFRLKRFCLPPGQITCQHLPLSKLPASSKVLADPIMEMLCLPDIDETVSPPARVDNVTAVAHDVELVVVDILAVPTGPDNVRKPNAARAGDGKPQFSRCSMRA